MVVYRKASPSDRENLPAVRIDFLRDAKNIRNEEDERTALDGAEIIGTSSASLYTLPPNAMRLPGKVAYIGNMFTYPGYRKQGIATKLLALTVELAKEAGCQAVYLDATETGRSLYEKYGFKRNEDAMSYYIQ